MAGRRRQRVEHTEDWEQLRLLVKWPEQERYEEIRPLVLFGDSVFERTEETRTSERTLYRRVESFERDGVEDGRAKSDAGHEVLSSRNLTTWPGLRARAHTLPPKSASARASSQSLRERMPMFWAR